MKRRWGREGRRSVGGTKGGTGGVKEGMEVSMVRLRRKGMKETWHDIDGVPGPQRTLCALISPSSSSRKDIKWYPSYPSPYSYISSLHLPIPSSLFPTLLPLFPSYSLPSLLPSPLPLSSSSHFPVPRHYTILDCEEYIKCNSHADRNIDNFAFQ